MLHLILFGGTNCFVPHTTLELLRQPQAYIQNNYHKIPETGIFYRLLCTPALSQADSAHYFNV